MKTTKKKLDEIMKEYHWDKNDIEVTIDFLYEMFLQYRDLWKKEKSNA